MRTRSFSPPILADYTSDELGIMNDIAPVLEAPSEQLR